MTPSTEPDAPAVVEVRRRVRAGRRPAAIVCAGCGASVRVKLRGPLPIWCSSTCRHRAWERRRAVAELAARGDGQQPTVALRETVEVAVPLTPERLEWIGVIAELTRQIANHDLPNGCLNPVYEALTVAINQAVYRDENYMFDGPHGFVRHRALAGREQVIDSQLDTHGPDGFTARANRDAAIKRSYVRREARMRRRFGATS